MAGRKQRDKRNMTKYIFVTGGVVSSFAGWRFPIDLMGGDL